MAYDKETIDSLFLQYVGSGESADLESLIVACEPMVGTVISKYDEMTAFRDDVIQEVMLRLWLVLCNRERAAQESSRPHNWVYKKILDATITVMRQYARQYGLSLRLTEREREIVDMHDSQQLSFDSIAAHFNVHPETVKCYYSIAHSKIESASRITNDKTLLEQADKSNLDPAKRYELKDLHRSWREKIHAMAEAHPNIGANGSACKAFKLFADDLLGKELVDE